MVIIGFASKKLFMYLKIHTPREYSSNKGSAQDLINYLEKENIGMDVENQEYFFSHAEENVSPYEVQNILDHNHKGLKANESKFYMLTINPSEAELKHIISDPDKLKDYTRSVMDEYAKNFNRTIDGRPLNGNDLVYYAKLEQTRMYKPEDQEHASSFSHNQRIGKESTIIKNDQSLQPSDKDNKLAQLDNKYQRDSSGQIILPGNQKAGLNQHIHVVISRKDKQQRLSLSPLANSKGGENSLNGKKVKIGFNREQFVDKAETIFDKKFGYQRPLEQSFQYHHGKIHDAEKFAQTIMNSRLDPKSIATKLVSKVLKDPIQQKLLYAPTTPSQLQSKLTKEAIKAVATLVKANPAGLPVELLHKTLMAVSKGIGQSTGIGMA